MTPNETHARIQAYPAFARAVGQLQAAYYGVEARVARATQVMGEAAPAQLLTLLNAQRARVLRLIELRNQMDAQIHQLAAEARRMRGVGEVTAVTLSILSVAVLAALSIALPAVIVAVNRSSAEGDAIRAEAQANVQQLEAATRVWEDQARQVAPGGQLPPLPQTPGQPRQDGPGDQIAKGAGALALLAAVVGGLWLFGGSRRR